MDTCEVYLIADSGGVKLPFKADLNQRMEIFLEIIRFIIGDENYYGFCIGNRIYMRDHYQQTLRELGFRQGIDIVMLAKYAGE